MWSGSKFNKQINKVFLSETAVCEIQDFSNVLLKWLKDYMKLYDTVHVYHLLSTHWPPADLNEILEK